MVKVLPIPDEVVAVLNRMLYQVKPPAERFQQKADFDMWRRPPPVDVSHAGTDFGGADLRPFMDGDEYNNQLLKVCGGERMTNAVVYPAGSIMSWHTNSSFPGIRRYYTWSKNGGGIFRYVDPSTGERHDSIDPPGWVCREFEVTIDPPLWHTIWAPEPRWAYGVMIEDRRDKDHD